MARSSLFLAASLGVALFACAADEGTAPTVKDLTLTPSALTVGKQATLDGTLVFEDADGDVDQLYAQIVVPGGASQTLAPQTIKADGIKSAPVKLLVAVIPPTAGDYTINVWVRDKQGHDSTKLSQTITAK